MKSKNAWLERPNEATCSKAHGNAIYTLKLFTINEGLWARSFKASATTDMSSGWYPRCYFNGKTDPFTG